MTDAQAKKISVKAMKRAWREQQAKAKREILKAVTYRLKSRIEEVFEMADNEEIDINWGDLKEIREQICGCLGNDLQYNLGDWVEEILNDVL